jgi:murein DD-endopeptidase MepM/ murein hydrolase activator NlpD
MKIYIPYKGRYWITQKYAENATSVYKDSGRKGHGAFDIVGLDDKTIYAGCDGYVFSVRNVEPDGDVMNYSAIYTLIEDNGIFYELTYGHVNASYVKPGEYVKKGQKIGTEGNRGYVATGGREVTRKEKENGSNAGSHLHYQLRMVMPVEKRTPTTTYLKDAKGYFKKDGMYFGVMNYDNGYLGCIDLAPHIIYESATATFQDKLMMAVKGMPISRVLRYGSRGEDVKTLQTLLKVTADGIFGVETDRAVKDFQKNSQLKVDGIVGPKTLEKLVK